MALLTASILSTATARAGCSHPGAAPDEGPDHFVLLRSYGAISPQDSTSHPVPPFPGGCTGPTCSDRSGLPLVPASISAPRVSQWAVLDAPPLASPQASTTGERDDRDIRPTLVADAIFHPPRRALVA